MNNEVNPNNIDIEEESVSRPFTDKNEDTYENEDDWLESTENEIDDLCVGKLFVS